MTCGRPGASLRSAERYVLSSSGVFLGAAVLALVGVTAWSYRGIVLYLWNDWRTSDDYSAGQLVPLVAVFLVWRDRIALSKCCLAPCWGAGIALLLAAQIVRTCGYLFMAWSVWGYSLVLTIGGLIVFVAGWQFFRRLFWILLFLFLMFPLPNQLHNTISGPLQNFATAGSVFLLEALGGPVEQQGNIVILGDGIPIAVAEACSGLRLLMAFIIVAAFVACMVKRSRLQKAILLVFSIPVAVICNIIRIFLTALVMLHVSVEVGEKFFHDFAGLVMMPAAVMLIFGLLWLMDHLTISETGTQESQISARTWAVTSVHDGRSHNNRRPENT